ncbi:MAG: TPM domain-containing protein [Flavobacteriales bacterium]|nr:TPM domain-containing protein [Flavobacteriales bacterium]MBS4039998.1 TPM domain-containing protein [Flavobacteriales bacterium]
MTEAEKFLTPEEEIQVVQAITLAEKQTSAEIKVHLESFSETPPLLRAFEVFRHLNMHQTKHRNGVLIYVCVQTHKLAIYADNGIYQIVHEQFWEAVKDVIIEHFQHHHYAKGLCEGIALAAEKLANYFPYTEGDINEISNEISKM